MTISLIRLTFEKDIGDLGIGFDETKEIRLCLMRFMFNDFVQKVQEQRYIF